MDKEPKKKSVVVDFLAYGASIGAAMLTMWSSIRKSFYNKMKELNVYDEIRNDPDTGRIVTEKAIIKRKLAGETLDVLEEVQKEGVKYSQKVHDIHVKLGFTNPVKKFLFLNKFEQARIGAVGLTVSSVAIGAFLGLRFKRDILDKINAKEKNSADAMQR